MSNLEILKEETTPYRIIEAAVEESQSLDPSVERKSEAELASSDGPKSRLTIDAPPTGNALKDFIDYILGLNGSYPFHSLLKQYVASTTNPIKQLIGGIFWIIAYIFDKFCSLIYTMLIFTALVGILFLAFDTVGLFKKEDFATALPWTICVFQSESNTLCQPLRDKNQSKPDQVNQDTNNSKNTFTSNSTPAKPLKDQGYRYVPIIIPALIPSD